LPERLDVFFLDEPGYLPYRPAKGPDSRQRTDIFDRYEELEELLIQP
jgi:hypothetical protein